VIINDADLDILTDDLIILKQDIFNDKDLVFHSIDVRKRKGVFVVLSNRDLAESFYKRFNGFITDSSLQFISVFINKTAHRKKYSFPYDPYEWSIGLIMERFAKVLKEDGAVGKIVVESRGKKEDGLINAAYIRNMYAGTAFIKGRTLQSVLGKELVFEPKKENGTGLQLADMMLYPVARAIINDDPRNPAFQVVAGKMRPGSGCHIFPSNLHPGWMTLAYTDLDRFRRVYFPHLL